MLEVFFDFLGREKLLRAVRAWMFLEVRRRKKFERPTVTVIGFAGLNSCS